MSALFLFIGLIVIPAGAFVLREYVRNPESFKFYQPEQ